MLSKVSTKQVCFLNELVTCIAWLNHCTWLCRNKTKKPNHQMLTLSKLAMFNPWDCFNRLKNLKWYGKKGVLTGIHFQIKSYVAYIHTYHFLLKSIKILNNQTAFVGYDSFLHVFNTVLARKTSHSYTRSCLQTVEKQFFLLYTHFIHYLA